MGLLYLYPTDINKVDRFVMANILREIFVKLQGPYFIEEDNEDTFQLILNFGT
jgi:hypothetical protein